MPQKLPIKVERIERLQRGKDRALAFLIADNDSVVDAKAVFDALSTDKQKLLRDRFDYWLQRGKHPPYFHGWDVPEHRQCFVFKWKENRQHQRLYGFLIHPCPETSPRLEVCVLVSHAQKNTELTDPAELRGVKIFVNRVDVVRAVKQAFPERRKGQRYDPALDRRRR